MTSSRTDTDGDRRAALRKRRACPGFRYCPSCGRPIVHLGGPSPAEPDEEPDEEPLATLQADDRAKASAVLAVIRTFGTQGRSDIARRAGHSGIARTLEYLIGQGLVMKVPDTVPPLYRAPTLERRSD